MTTLNQNQLTLAIQSNWPHPCVFDLHNELPSTNQHLSARVLNEPSLPTTICITEKQTGGVGRRGKPWHSPDDSITMSVHYRFDRPPAELMGLSLVTGIAVTDVLLDQVPADYSVKWPNDILVNHKKLAGLLIDIPQSDQSGTSTVTGIGINYRRGEELNKIDQPYTLLGDLQSELPAKEMLIGLIAGKLLSYYTLFAHSGWSEFADRWQQRDYLYGKSVNVIGEKQLIQGVASGVAADGGLIIRSNGAEKTYYGGEVSVRVIE